MLLHGLRAPLAIGLLLLSTGAASTQDGCIASTQVEVKEVCVTHRNVTIGAADGTQARTSFTLEDLGKVGKLATLDASMYFTRITIVPEAGAVASVSSASASISSGDPASSLPTLAATCESHCIDEDGTIAVPAGVESDAVAYVLSGSLAIGLEVTGELPTTPWAADIAVCMVGSFNASL